MWSKISKTGLGFAVLIATLPACVSHAANPPTNVGECSDTSVAKVGTRLGDGSGNPIAGSGTSIRLTNGIYLVSYDTVQAAEASKPGDKVRACLKSVPQNCPPGDTERGKTYTVLNYRTQQSFTMPNSEHTCGGA